MNESSLQLQDFFFEAALATYAGHAPKTTIEGLPKSKVYRYERDNYLYIDTYFTNGELSCGQTIIYITKNSATFVPAWIMQYYGWCKGDDKKVLDFLKEVLSRAYQTRRFYGGRGRETNSDQYLEYRNNWIGTFDEFAGNESILQGSTDEEEVVPKMKQVFWHKYQGMTLTRNLK